MKIKLSITVVIVFISMFFTMNSAFGHVITVGDATEPYDPDNDPGVYEVNISVTNPTDIAAAAFTIEFKEVDGNQQEVATEKVVFDRVESAFFETFSAQGIEVPTGFEYDQPVVANADSNGVKIAGAQSQTHTQTDDGGVDDAITTLFTIYVKIVEDGTYKLNIKQTTLDNVSAGYDPNDGVSDKIPYLVGLLPEQSLDQAYPSLNVDDVAHGTITVVSFIDEDGPNNEGDGMDDNWEIEQFGSTEAADANTDHDQDGYSDLEEYLYSKDPHDEGYNSNDPDGIAFDAWVPNADGGLGHDRINDLWDKIHYVTPEAMMRYNNGLVFDYGNKGWGIWSYSREEWWQQLTTSNPSVMQTADVDGNGEDRLAAGFDGYDGYWIHNYGRYWDWIEGDATPEAMATFGDKLIIDYGDGNGSGVSNGLWSYDQTNSSVKLKEENPGLVVAANVDQDVDIELVASFSDGVYLYDNGAWTTTPIDTHIPEQMVKYNGGVAIDFGANGGLRSYFDGVWEDLGPEVAGVDDPGIILSADLIDGGDLVAVFANITTPGVYVYGSNAASWQLINDSAIAHEPIRNIAPEGLIQYGNGLAADFGDKGLFTYNQTDDWNFLTKLNAGQMVALDFDGDGVQELAVNFPVEGFVYIFDETKTVYPYVPLACDFGNYTNGGVYVYNQSAWFQATTSDSNTMTWVDIDDDGVYELVAGFSKYGGANGINILDDTEFLVSPRQWVVPEPYGAAPEKMIGHNNVLAVDYGSQGLYIYIQDSGTIISKLVSTSSPDIITWVDIDNDGIYELAASFSGYGSADGIYVLDDAEFWQTNPQWSELKVEGQAPEAMIGYNNILATDFGGAGVIIFKEDSGTFVSNTVTTSNPKEIVWVDVDEDGVYELITTFFGYGSADGIYVLDDDQYWEAAPQWLPRITSSTPEKMIGYGPQLVGDFGNYTVAGKAYTGGGVYAYTTESNWYQLTSSDPAEMTWIDNNGDGIFELTLNFTAYGGANGIYHLPTGGEWGWITPSTPEKMVGYIP